MARLHVVYDPTEKLTTDDLPKEMRRVSISLSEKLDPDQIGEITAELAEILLEQLS